MSRCDRQSPPGRRSLLRVFGAAGLASGLGCSRKPPPVCLDPVPGAPARTYCIVESGSVRIPGGANLLNGEAQLYNIDDNSAVVLVRDDRGLYAISGICTHMCCLLTLCNDPACMQPRTNPGDCAASGITRPSPMGLALICPCHGSTFRLDGSVLTGPVIGSAGATTPLPHYRVSIDGIDAVVSIGVTVDVGMRI